ncbi:hypothetical protein NSQ77_02795 [Oceanobacillus sp. FSL K6-2867]
MRLRVFGLDGVILVGGGAVWVRDGAVSVGDGAVSAGVVLF